MTTALHRIWAFHAGPLVGMFVGRPEYGANVAEYIRADVAEGQKIKSRALSEALISGKWTDEMCRAFAEGHDREEAAQRGEPNPWNLDDAGDIGDADGWRAERVACVRAGLAEVVKATLTSD